MNLVFVRFYERELLQAGSGFGKIKRDFLIPFLRKDCKLFF